MPLHVHLHNAHSKLVCATAVWRHTKLMMMLAFGERAVGSLNKRGRGTLAADCRIQPTVLIHSQCSTSRGRRLLAAILEGMAASSSPVT